MQKANGSGADLTGIAGLLTAFASVVTALILIVKGRLWVPAKDFNVVKRELCALQKIVAEMQKERDHAQLVAEVTEAVMRHRALALPPGDID